MSSLYESLRGLYDPPRQNSLTAKRAGNTQRDANSGLQDKNQRRTSYDQRFISFIIATWCNKRMEASLLSIKAG